MDELEKLRRQFQELQKQDVKHRLSERNCVEIIMKLVSAKMLEVIYTNDGKQYLTPKQLELEIQDEILRSGGRINVVDLPALLNVDSTHVTRKVDAILQTDRDLSLVDGEIISSFYADRIVAEIGESLAENGQLLTQSLGARFSLGTAFLEKVLTKKIASGKLKAHLQNGILFTSAFVERHKARVRGIFSAATRPVHIKTVIDKYNLQEDLTYSGLAELIEAGELQGYQSGKKQFTPKVFEEARDQWVRSFFHSNSFIAYASMDKLDISNPKEEIKKLFPNGVALDTTYVSSSVVDIAEDAVAEALSSDSYIDISAHVSAPLSEKDFTKLIEKLPSMQQKNPPSIFGNYIVSNGFKERCVKLFEQDITEEIEKKGVQKAPVPEAKPKNTEPDSDEEEERSSKGKGKGKKRAAKKEPVKQQQSTKSKDNKGPDESIQKLTKWFPQCESDLLYALANNLKGTIAQIRTKAEQAASAQSMSASREKHEAVSQQVAALLVNLHLFRKGLDEFSEADPKADVVQLEKHLLKTLATDVTNVVARDLGHQYKINISENNNNTSPLSANDKSTLLNQLPPAISKTLDKTFTLLSKQSVEDFLVALEPLADACQIQLVRKLDKKKESQLLQMHSEDLTKQLNAEENPATAFHQAVLLMYIRTFNAILHAPPKNIQMIVARLQTKLPKKTFDFVKDFQNGVVKFLTAKSSDDKETEMENLKEKLDELKELALNTSAPSN